VPVVDVLVVTDEADNCTTNPTVTFISETSDNNVCNGEELQRVYEIADDCGNTTTVTHTIIIDSYTPIFTLSGANTTICGGTDGIITVGGLDPNTSYSFEYGGNGVTSITTNAAGEYLITGLVPGSYTSFTVSDENCPACFTTDGQTINITDPNPPSINAGPDQQVCEGSTVTLTAVNPDGATTSWDNGVVDGSPFTPGAGTVTYTVTANLAGCINTDQVEVIVITAPVINPLANSEVCDSYTFPAITGTNLNGNEAYYDATSAGGTQYNPGDLITTAGTSTFYIYDETGTIPNCVDEESFDVTINLTPVIDALSDQEICDEYLLPTITGVNLTGNEAYYDAPTGGGTQYNAGDNFTTVGTTTLYIYDETATTPNCFNQQSFDVTINLTPELDVLADQETCDTYTLPIINGTNLTGNEAYYDAPNGNGNQYVAGDELTTAGTTSLYIYDETGTTPNCFEQESFDLIINSTPEVDPLLDQEECDSYTLPVITGSNLTGNEAYYDAPSGGGIQYNDGDAITAAGVTTLYIYDQTGITINCFDEQTFDVTINITPTFTLSSTDPTTCNGADGTITISDLEPNIAYNITYTSGGTPVGPNVISSDALGDIVMSGLIAGSYSDFVVSLNGCSNTDNTSIVLADPNPPVIGAGLDQVICEGEDITLTAINPDGASVTWDNGVTDGVPFNPAVGTITYTVTASLVGCISTDQVDVTVNPLPVVSAGNDIVVCNGDQVVLTGSGADSFTWDNGVDDGQQFTPSSTNTYTVTGSTLGCESTDEVVVTVVDNPVVDFEADTTTGCVPLTVNFTNLTQGSIVNSTYTISDGTIISELDIIHTFSEAGCYDVTLEIENANGCISTITFQDYICVENYPIADFEVEPGQVTNIYNQIVFTNLSSGASTYEWDFGDDETSSNLSPTHTYDNELGQNGYEVSLVATSQFGCSDTARTILPFIEELIFYVPNTFTPDDNKINETFKPVFTSGFDPSDYELMIYNRWGELIYESDNPAIGWDGTYGGGSGQFVPEGTYVWKIKFKRKHNAERKVEVGHVNILR
jgi:gliding motility-associated-like protein